MRGHLAAFQVKLVVGARRGCCACPQRRHNVPRAARIAACRVLRLVGHAQSLGQSPDVVVGKAQSFDLSQFCFFWQHRQDAPQRVQSGVQVVHPVALPVVRLNPAPATLSSSLASAFVFKIRYGEHISDQNTLGFLEQSLLGVT